MTIDADACARSLAEAYDSGDFQTLLKVVSHPCAIYLGDEVLVLAHPGELLRFVTLQKIAAFRTKTGRVHCELLSSEPVGPDSLKAMVRFRSSVRNSPHGNVVLARMFMRKTDGAVKCEMMEIIDHNPNTPLVLAFRQLATSKQRHKSACQ